ncbi:helix-turn-helix domain-containing protein [Spongisporangium articulatum]|uniref:Helix-turn-helix domain-containing protein n=1 Tax=Spongisporangium articulatum TaxID=3362603 RepID=A0ABW8ASC1_9ACTN
MDGSDTGRLIRNTLGIARDRDRSEPLGSRALEQAIAQNARTARLRSGLSVAEMADRVGISKAMLSKIENAQTSCSLATLHRLALGLDVPVTALLRGADEERAAVYTPAGSGPRIARAGIHDGHEYELLGALRGQHKRLESLMVTLTEDSQSYPMFQHPGTEFIHLLEGEMAYGHGDSVYHLAPGDSLQFDGEGPHGPVELPSLPARPVRFLSVIAFPDSTP